MTRRGVVALLVAAGGAAQVLPDTVPMPPGLGTALSLGAAAAIATGLVVLGSLLGRPGAAPIVAGALLWSDLQATVAVQLVGVALPLPVPQVARVAVVTGLVVAAVALAAASLHGPVCWVLALPAVAETALLVATLLPTLEAPWLGELPGAAWMLAGLALALRPVRRPALAR